jgi:hypothetical protein
MAELIFFIYCACLFTALLIGIARYKYIDNAMRVIIVLLLVTSISEILSFVVVQSKEYTIRYMIYHFYGIIQMFLQILFFIYAINNRESKKMIIVNAVACLSICILNIIFFQPINTLNSNILILESLTIITLSLYFIYLIIKKDIVGNIFTHPHFWIAIFFLILWSSTFFFWAFIRILYRSQWQYRDLIMHTHAIVNVFVYAGIAAIFFFYPKMKKLENR